MSETATTYLDIYLGPLREQMQRPDVTDLYVNRPGELWVETLGRAIERFDAPDLTEAVLWRLARQVASVTHQGISREHPLLAARLPDGSRVQVVAPPATRGPLALAIRKHVSASLTLDQMQAQGMFARTRGREGRSAADEELTRLHQQEAWVEFLKLALKARKTILVSGGTSTGKTTFLNALLQEIGGNERLVLIEDTPELQLSQPNAVGLTAVRGHLGETAVTPDDLMIASLRMRPDRIILGELRGSEAFTFLRAINTGHPGSLSTIHADSGKGALEQLVLMVLQAERGLRRADVLFYAEQTIDVMVQLERSGGRQVSEVVWQSRSNVY